MYGPAHETPPPAASDSLIGTQVGAFTLVKKIGEGGMGAVYLGEHGMIGSKVAVKLLHPHLAANREVVNRFFAEARAVNVIGHENIVSIFDLNQLPPNQYYLVMEYLEGDPLSALIGKPMEPALTVKILMQVCDALEAAHDRGVVHRDLKPENIFVIKRGRNAHFVKVLDFGIAKLFNQTLTSERTSIGTVIGTPEYMSPEQAIGERIDGRSDLYALGVIAYRLLTGELPFTGRGLAGILLAHQTRTPKSPELVRPGLPPALCQAVMRALSKEPADRFQSAASFAEALEGSLQAAPPTPLPTPPPRHQAGFEGVLERDGRPPLTARCQDISKGGVFLSGLSELPPLFSRAQLTLTTPEGPLKCPVEIVRHITEEQAKVWSMQPGAGVQFVEPSTAFRTAVAKLIGGLPVVPSPVTPAPGGDPEADKVLDSFRDRPDDPYLVIGARADADFGELRELLKEARRSLATVGSRKLSETQRMLHHRLVARLDSAESTLSTAEPRARHDAARGNFAGVARSIAAGLSPDKLAELRREFLKQRPDAASRAEIHLIAGEAFAAQGELKRAITELESGLAADPLSFSLHQRYWKLRRRV